MKRIHRYPAVLLSVFLLFGCSARTALDVPPVLGADTTHVKLYLDNDTGTVILSGHVNRAVEKAILEKYVREELGYTDISNQLTF